MRGILYVLLNRHIWISRLIAKKRFRGYTPGKTPKFVTFIDLDGTLMPDIGPGGLLRGNTIYSAWQSIRTGQMDASWVVITNQTYFARQDRFATRDMLRYLRAWLSLIKTLKIDAVLICHHHPQALSLKLRRDCNFRKPSGSLIARYAKMQDLDLSKSSLIGDRITDMIAATSAGIPKALFIYNSRMFEENISGNDTILDYAFFSLLSIPDKSSFHREINELI